MLTDTQPEKTVRRLNFIDYIKAAYVSRGLFGDLKFFNLCVCTCACVRAFMPHVEVKGQPEGVSYFLP